jgi:hypothetical protein
MSTQDEASDQMKLVMKCIGAKELMDMGLLFEINRRVLHPFGLALEVVVDEKGACTFGGVWDYRDDPEGISYDEETFKRGLAKFNTFLDDFGRERLETRTAALGYIYQVDEGEDT